MMEICIVKDSDLEAVCTGMPLSDTWTVKLAFSAVVGIPLITPVLDSVRPAGNLPGTAVQLYGVVPPIAVKL